MQNFKTLRQSLLGELVMSPEEREKREKKIPLAPMGVLAHCLRTLDRSVVPPSTQAEIFRRMCLQSHLQTPPPTPRSNIRSFGTLGQLFKIPPFSAQNFVLVGILIFLLLRSPCKISKPYDNPFWEN